MNLADVLSQHARARPDHPAIEEGDRTVTYRALDRLVTGVAANLQTAGVGTDDVVVVVLRDSVEHLILLYALARVGATILSLPTGLARYDIEQSMSGIVATATISSRQAPRLAGLRHLNLKDLCRPTSAMFSPPEVGPDHPLLLVQSSGTTGVPKTFVRSHAQKREWIRRTGRDQGWVPEERSFSLIGMSFHTGRGMYLGMLQFGATIVIERAVSFGTLADVVHARRISFLKVATSHFPELLKHAAGRAPLFPDLRAMVVSGAPITQARRLRVRERLTPNFIEIFGCNETGSLTVAAPVDQDAYPDSVGRLVEGAEAEIVDADGVPLPVGEVGQVRFRNPGFPTAYLNDPEASARAFRDGWFYPGDLAMLNEDGYLFFKGRADDVINNAGVKFYPREVETALLAHAEVAEAAAFGWPHGQAGEVAVACVVARSAITEKDLKAFCAKRLPAFKVPMTIKFLSEMPKNALGKTLKAELRQTFGRDVADRSS